MIERPFRPHPKPEPRNKGEIPTRQRPQPARVSLEKAGEIAVLGLSWLAGDPKRFDKFLSLTGIDHGAIREAAQQAGFLAAVLEHLCADEESLLAFAAESNLAPEVISGAAVTLSGPAEWQSI